MSKFYDTDPDDPDAPRELTEYASPHHGTIKPGDRVAYENPAWRRGDGTYRTGGMDGPLVITEIISSGDFVTAVLNDGEYECNADNLRTLSPDEIAREGASG